MEKTLSTFFKEYTANRQKIWETNQHLLEEMTFNKWRDVLVERAKITRDIYSDNNRFIIEIRHFLKNGIDESIAKKLFEVVKGFYDGGYDDLFVMRNLAKPAIRFYEERSDYEKLCHLYKILGYEFFEFYGRIDKENGPDEAAQYYEKCIALQKHYRDLKDASARLCIFTSYNNLIAPIGQTTTEYRSRMFRYYHEAMDLWNQNYVQELDGKNEDFLACIGQIEANILFAEEFVEKMPLDFTIEFAAAVPYIKEKWNKEGMTDDEGSLFRAEIKCRLIKGEKYEPLIEDTIEYLDNMGDVDFEKDEEESIIKVMNYHNCSCTIFSIFKWKNVEHDVRRMYMDRFCKKVTDFQKRIPFGVCPQLVDEMCAEWFTEYAPFIDDPVEKKELLLKLVIIRQPLTYIHSLMVSEIAMRIAHALITQNPSYFVGIPGYPDEKAVKDNQKELLDYIADCGLIHDCGKCRIVGVVSRQDRHLYDEEFEIIKRHPMDGFFMLNHDPKFSKYFDIIRGHHKFFDGNGGYPESFDNLKSPYKPVIDLISISDSIDAATDILGRNYTKGKDFSTVFEELSHEAGTRYSPSVIELIKNKRGLYEDLDYLTKDGRFEIYFRAYKEILYI